MEGVERLSSQWDKSPRGTSAYSPGLKPHNKKSAFTKTRFEIDDNTSSNSNYNEFTSAKMARSPESIGGNRKNTRKPHTIIQIEKLSETSLSTQGSIKQFDDKLEKYSSESENEQKLSRSLRKRNRNFRESSDIEEESEREESKNVKTTSALLLAEDVSEILGSQLLNNGSGRNFWSSVEFVNPVHWKQEDWNEWNKLTFLPSNKPVPLSEKSIDIETQIASDEGIFTGEPVGLSKGNWNLLEWRILSEKSKLAWFGADGKLFSYADPYRSQLIQLFNDNGISDIHRSLKFIPARLDDLQDYKSDLNSLQEFEIDLGYVNFFHHSYFSKEHVVASTLLQAYEEYATRRIHKVTERAANKLRALREAVAYTKKSIKDVEQRIEKVVEEEKRSDLLDTLSQHKDRLKGYRKEIRKSLLARDQGHWDDKTTISAVISAWKDLKYVREQQGFCNTSLKLNILELPSNAKEELKIWGQDIEDDIQDVEDECEDIFEFEMARYRAKMKKWTTSTGKSRRGVQSNASGDFANGVDEDSDISISRRPKPKPPVKQDFGDLRKRLERRYKDIRRRPGEPNIILELLKTSPITSAKQLPEDASKEKERRKALKKCLVEIQLWLNGNEIYTSKPRNINSDFSVFLGFKIPISIHESPDLLELQVIEKETKLKTLKIAISVPEKTTTIDRSQMRQAMFFAEDKIIPSNGGVGCGIDIDIYGKDYSGLNTKGTITLRCGWSVNENIKLNLNVNDSDFNEKTNKNSIDVRLFGTDRKLSDSSSQMDPNDPKNAFRYQDGQIFNSQTDILSSHHDTRQLSVDENHGNKLDRMMEEFDFCKIDLLDKSVRYRMLQLRDQGVPEFKNIRMISPYERDINTNSFLAYERRLKEELQKRNGDKTIIGAGRKKHVDENFVYDSNRLEKIRNMRLGVLQLFEKSLKQITFEDLVLEEQIPEIGTLGLNLITALFQPRRPLRPIRKERKRIFASNLVDTKPEIIFNISRAFNLPIRKDNDLGLLTTESLTGVQLMKKRTDRTSGNYSTVRPFVEVWFQRKKVRTTTALGSNPTWNQELQLSLTVPNDDFSQANLSRMDDTIFLLVYDEVSVDLLEDERRRETDIYQRTERRWIGSISIPFSTLYINGRIEGTFKLNMPQVLLGYEPQGFASNYGGVGATPKSILGINTSSSNITGAKTIGAPSPAFNNETHAFLTIFITLQPAVQSSISIKEDNATGESGDMMSFVKNWKNSFESKFPDRNVRPFVMTADGDTILCTRYLTSVEPPQCFLPNNSDETDQVQDLFHTMEMLAHYVSLFPYVRDSTLGITDYSLWFVVEVFLMTPGGGMDDHAVLLACYFLHLNVPCWIVQGNAIPDGPTTFVVTSFKGIGENKLIPKHLKHAVLLWNPCTGEYFNANDNFCPLQKVWCAIGKQNIWANVSESERPHQIDWNIGKSKSWLPLFGKGITEDKIPCIQVGLKKYKNSDQVQANSLAQKIERNLKDAFMKWRSTTKTNWNRYCSANLRRLLPKLEDRKSGRSRPQEVPGSGSIESAVSLQSGSLVNLNDEHLIELKEITTSYQMSGFPLQQAYVNMNSIMETVFATGLHTIDTPDVEFALAAYAHAYPASVYSVWIYVAALHRRR